ncbi:hypothetical protein [Duganella vulcania]|uniref:hypothetical protein n=1 Tax=Duganella vulcania TaxID=2692166 RepID=UPI001581676B|nr:hypothetical protein [Duganella vulcania]
MQNLPGANASINFHESHPPMSPTASNLAVLKLYSQANSDAGMGKIPARPARRRRHTFIPPIVSSAV